MLYIFDNIDASKDCDKFATLLQIDLCVSKPLMVYDP